MTGGGEEGRGAWESGGDGGKKYEFFLLQILIFIR